MTTHKFAYMPRRATAYRVRGFVAMWLDSHPSGCPNEAAENISCPLLIVRGDDDHLVSREAAVELCGVVEKSTLLNIPFAGHVAFEDHKEIFMAILNEFLDQSCCVAQQAAVSATQQQANKALHRNR